MLTMICCIPIYISNNIDAIGKCFCLTDIPLLSAFDVELITGCSCSVGLWWHKYLVPSLDVLICCVLEHDALSACVSVTSTESECQHCRVTYLPWASIPPMGIQSYQHYV